MTVPEWMTYEDIVRAHNRITTMSVGRDPRPDDRVIVMPPLRLAARWLDAADPATTDLTLEYVTRWDLEEALGLHLRFGTRVEGAFAQQQERSILEELREYARQLERRNSPPVTSRSSWT